MNKPNHKDISSFSIFGEYKQDENRITSALLHIVKNGGEPLINAILESNGFKLPDSEILVETQVKEDGSIPDGKISCNFSFNLLIESKIVPNAINIEQLENHKKAITTTDDYLLYLTPDRSKPKELDDNVLWLSWEALVNLLNNFKDDNNNLLSFLIEQFQILVENKGLIDRLVESRVVIVGGLWGEDIALKYNFYMCPPERNFQKCKYLAFAFNHRIKYLFEILSDESNVDLYKRDDVGDYLLNNPNHTGERRFFKLKLVHEFTPVIDNDSKDHKGTRCAFTQNRRYTSYDKIMSARKTSDLV